VVVAVARQIAATSSGAGLLELQQSAAAGRDEALVEVDQVRVVDRRSLGATGTNEIGWSSPRLLPSDAAPVSLPEVSPCIGICPAPADKPERRSYPAGEGLAVRFTVGRACASCHPQF